MPQVLFYRCKELPELGLIEFDLRLTQRMDETSDTKTHNLAALSPIEPLFFDPAHQSLHLGEDIRSSGQALSEVILSRDSVVVRAEASLVFGLFLDDVAFFQRKRLKGFLKDLLTVDDRVAR